MQFWRKRGWIGLWSVAAAAAVLAGCATSSRQHTEGLNEMAAGDTEKGLASLAAASAAEPTNSQYRLDYLKQLFLTVTHLLAQADDALRAKQYDAAGQLYRDTLKVDGGNDRALRGLQNIEADKRHDAMLAEAEKLLAANDMLGARQLVHTVLQEDGSRLDAKQLATRIADDMDKAEAVRTTQLEAGSVMKKPVSLQFRDANLRMVFEALSRTTGLNVIFDRDVRNDVKTTIFVHDASVADTVDMILLQSQLEKKVLNANTLFIYPATAAKQKEYQDLKVRIFQLSNADGKTVQNTLKTVLKVADMTLDEKTNTLIVRATQDTIAVAEKIVAVQDYPDSEVMLEIEVLEVNRDRVRNLGIQWPSSFGVQHAPTVNTIHDLVHIPLNQLQVLGGPFGATAQLFADGQRRQRAGRAQAAHARQPEGQDPDRREGAGDHQHGDAGVDRLPGGDRIGAVPGRGHQAGSEASCVSGRRRRHRDEPGGEQHPGGGQPSGQFDQFGHRGL